MSYSLSFQGELADSDEVLCDLGEALFTLVSEEARPVDEIYIYLFQSLLVILAQLYLERENSMCSHTVVRPLIEH